MNYPLKARLLDAIIKVISEVEYQESMRSMRSKNIGVTVKVVYVDSRGHNIILTHSGGD